MTNRAHNQFDVRHDRVQSVSLSEFRRPRTRISILPWLFVGMLWLELFMLVASVGGFLPDSSRRRLRPDLFVFPRGSPLRSRPTQAPQNVNSKETQPTTLPGLGTLSPIQTSHVHGDADSQAQPPPSADSVRRRQLLLSLLVGLSTNTFVKPAPADDTILQSAPINSEEMSSPVNILKPPLDDREYETYQLPNGLRVLLCSDPSSNEAAGAMDVHVGASSDPDDIPGLAHFCEHMLFLGTEPYPKEDSFSAFLSTNGGSSNAFTDSENTVFYFSMEAEADEKLKQGLYRFGSFFTSPLFTPSATERELNAIESENAKNLQSDIFRLYQIEKSRANSEHPFSKFYTGNKKTLLDDTTEKGIDLRQALVEFWETYYSANQMTLAIVAPQSISTLKKVVNDSFGAIPNRDSPKPELSWANVPAYGGDSAINSFGYIVQVVPVQDLRQLTLSWPILYRSEEDRIYSLLLKQEAFVCHLLGHEGPNSLLSYLKRVGWANALGCSTQNELSDFETLDVTVELTTQGLAAVKDVTGAVFSYLSMLRKEPIPDFIFQEVLQLEELEWRYLTKGNPSNYVSSLATAMQKYPPSLYVAGPRRLALAESATVLLQSSEPRTSFLSVEQEALVKRLSSELVGRLSYDKVMVTVLSKTFEGKVDRREMWYSTQYGVRPISPLMISRMKNPFRPADLGMSYPKVNAFIPSEAGLQVKLPPKRVDQSTKRSFESRMKPVTPPRVIRDDGPDGRWTVYFKEDDRFGQPKAYVVFQLLTKDAMSTPSRAVLGQLYQTCATDRLEEYAYNARLAGLSYDVQVLPRGVRLTFGGYNEKLKEFASYVGQKLVTDTKNNVVPRNNFEFDRYKDNAMRALSAFDVKQPYAHASYYSYLTLKPLRFEHTNAELRSALRDTTLADLEKYVNSLWSSGKGEALVQGNFETDEALELVDSIDMTLDFEVIPESALPPRIQALPLPSGPKVTHLLIAEPNPSNENSAAHVVLQDVIRSEKDHVLIELLSAIIEQPLYDELRTKQQLGYIVGSGLRAIEETRTLAFIVQSSIASADTLAARILEFLDTFEEKTLMPLNEGDIAVYVKGLIDRKTEPDKTLATEVTRNWSEIASGRLQFDRIQKEAAALLDLQKSDLLSYWGHIYTSEDRRMLITTVVPREGPASTTEPSPNAGYTPKELSDKSVVSINVGSADLKQFRRDREAGAKAIGLV